MPYKSFSPSDLSIPDLHAYMLGAVSPRPIAFASTIDKDGNVNLAPFSFFNAFSSAPPILVFSANRSGRTGETKDTYKNIKEVPEVVINIVNYDMMYQMSFASSEFEKGVDEFVKTGLTPVGSSNIKPPRVGESPVSFECKVNQVIELGDTGGAGNLFICEIVKIHVKESVLNEAGKIDPLKMKQVARCGGAFYTTVNESNMFEIPQPRLTLGVGVDQIPDEIRNSNILTGNDLGKLALIEIIPNADEVSEFQASESCKYLMSFEGQEKKSQTHKFAQEMLKGDKIKEAWVVLMAVK
jgi:flavin reductase (DIM6/NTAB) family NADH-FMN oxidoreductase RutF